MNSSVSYITFLSETCLTGQNHTSMILRLKNMLLYNILPDNVPFG